MTSANIPFLSYIQIDYKSIPSKFSSSRIRSKIKKKRNSLLRTRKNLDLAPYKNKHRIWSKLRMLLHHTYQMTKAKIILRI